MINRLVALIVAAVTSITGLGVQTADAISATSAWSKRANRAIAAFQAAESYGAEGRDPFVYAYMADAVARQSSSGWDDPTALRYLDMVLALQQDDGGFGLTTSSNLSTAFDGSPRPADTTFTITVTDHVGPPLLAAYRAGKVPRSVIDAMLAELLSVPRWMTRHGMCVAYSDTPGDTGVCVHNVNASVALFLRRVEAAGIPTGQAALISSITATERTWYQSTTHFWPYSTASRKLNDWDHNALNAEAMRVLSPSLGRSVTDWMVLHYGDASTPLAHFHLAQYRPWIVNSNFDTYLQSISSRPYRLVRYAQLARWAAMASDAAV